MVPYLAFISDLPRIHYWTWPYRIFLSWINSIVTASSDPIDGTICSSKYYDRLLSCYHVVLEFASTFLGHFQFVNFHRFQMLGNQSEGAESAQRKAGNHKSVVHGEHISWRSWELASVSVSVQFDWRAKGDRGHGRWSDHQILHGTNICILLSGDGISIY